MKWLKADLEKPNEIVSPREKVETPVSIEKRVSPEEFRLFFNDYDNFTGVKVGEPYTDVYGSITECPKCKSKNVEQMWGFGDLYQDYKCKDCGSNFTHHKDGKIEVDGQSYYNPSKNLDIGDSSSGDARLFEPTPQPEKVQPFSYWPQVYDY